MDTNDWAAKVSDIEERENGARLFTAFQAADDALREARYNGFNEETLRPELQSALDAIHTEARRRYHEVELWQETERTKILGSSNPLASLEAAADAASTAYNDAPGDAIAEGDDGDVLRCALSGVPLYESDITIEIGGKTVLASLFVPPSVIESLSADDEDEGGEIEEAA